MATRSTWVRPLIAMIAIAVAIGTATACGDEDQSNDSSANASDSASSKTNDSSSGGSTGGSQSAGSSGQSGGDEAQIRTLITEVQEAFKTGEGDVICDGLTTAGQRDLEDYGRVMSLPGSCPEVAAGITKANRDQNVEQPPIRIAAVRVDGPNATAVIKVKGGGTVKQNYVKIGDEWKIRSFGIGKAVGG